VSQALQQKLDSCQLADVFRLQKTLSTLARESLSKSDLASATAAVEDDMAVEDVIAAVGPECAQYVPSEPPSDAASFLASVPDSCKSVFAGLLSE